MAHLLVSYGTHYLFTSEKLGLEKDFFGSFKYDAQGKVRWIKLLWRFPRQPAHVYNDGNNNITSQLLRSEVFILYNSRWLLPGPDSWIIREKKSIQCKLKMETWRFLDQRLNQELTRMMDTISTNVVETDEFLCFYFILLTFMMFYIPCTSSIMLYISDCQYTVNITQLSFNFQQWETNFACCYYW